jgi:hypothetical protein
MKHSEIQSRNKESTKKIINNQGFERLDEYRSCCHCEPVGRGNHQFVINMRLLRRFAPRNDTCAICGSKILRLRDNMEVK